MHINTASDMVFADKFRLEWYTVCRNLKKLSYRTTYKDRNTASGFNFSYQLKRRV